MTTRVQNEIVKATNMNRDFQCVLMICITDIHRGVRSLHNLLTPTPGYLVSIDVSLRPSVIQSFVRHPKTPDPLMIPDENYGAMHVSKDGVHLETDLSKIVPLVNS